MLTSEYLIHKINVKWIYAHTDELLKFPSEIYTAHPAVFIWHQSSRASLAERVSLLSSVSILITWI